MLECLDVKTQLTWLCGSQAAQPFTEQHYGALLIAPLKMVMGHGNLEHALKYRPKSPLGFMPDRLKIIMTSVPFTAIEGGHTGLEALILNNQHFLSREGTRGAQGISAWQAYGLAACVNESIQG